MVGRVIDAVKTGLDWAASIFMVALVVALATGYVRLSIGPPQSTSATRSDPPLPPEPISLAGQRIGNQSADSVVIVFSDFQCPFCRKFATGAWRQLFEEYVKPGRVQVVFKHLPLQALHSDAYNLAAAAVCAGDQGYFEAVHDQLFEPATAAAGLESLRHPAGLDRDKFTRCLKSDGPQAVDRDLAFAKELGVEATPTLMVGTLVSASSARIVLRRDGAASFEELQRMLERTVLAR
jgi:protein-disulfide isomerase